MSNVKAPGPSVPPPPATRREARIEELHGRRIADPYRWLESTGDEVDEWIDAQNARTRAVLDALEVRREFAERLTRLLTIGSVSRPAVCSRGDGKYRYFTSPRDAGENQIKLVVRDGLDGPDRVVVDPNQLDGAGTTALDWYYPSPDGSRLAYGLSSDGTERSTLHVLDVDTGTPIGPPIERTRGCSLAWFPDSGGFVFSRYPAPDSVPPDEESYHRALFVHRIGEDPESATELFRPEEMTGFPTCTLSPDGRWLAATVFLGWSRSEVFLARVEAGQIGELRKITPHREALYEVKLRNEELFILTNEDSPRYRVFSTSLNTPTRENWREIIAEHPKDVLDSVTAIGGQLLVTWQRDGQARLERFSGKGDSLGIVPLPVAGASSGFTGHHAGQEAFFDFESFVQAPTVFRIDLSTGDTSLWQASAADIDPNEFRVSTHHATSKDGTDIPYVMVHHQDTLLEGDAPTLLYGYGGFNHTLYPRFSRTNLAWIERGGVYVQANLRGGNERGEAWHQGGKGPNKQNTFDDFYAVAEHLIERGITRTERLAIHGRSNGGLLVAAAITQRPELFRAAVTAVPLTDMVRYTRFLVARLWIPEYGDPDDAEELEWLMGYSPYHHVKPGVSYPATLVTTAAGDSRVDPLHARKFVAALQQVSPSSAPLLLRTETEAGHGAGKPISKVVDEYSDVFAFLAWQIAS